MISIVIASANPTFLKDITNNIAITIGVEYEIISFENNIKPKGLCEIYNIGAQRAKYYIICYMHEDIIIETHNWGQKVIDLMNENSQLGIIGIAGSTYKSINLSIWCPPEEIAERISWRMNIQQSFKFKEKPEKHYYYNPLKESLSKVACVDGVWFCTRKEIALQYKFDEKLLKGFHGYDTDFCLQVQQHYDIFVIYDVLIKHFSEGNLDERWLIETLKVHKKWSKYLPVNYDSILSLSEAIKIEKEIMPRILKDIVKKKTIPFRLSANYLLKSYINHHISLTMYMKLLIKLLKHRILK